MAEFQKIEYYDLCLEAKHQRFFKIVGREEEQERLSSVIGRTSRNNCMVVAPPGSGKTMLVHGWAANIQSSSRIIRIEAESLYGISNAAAFPRYQEAFAGIPSCVLFIDSFGSLVHNKAAIFQQTVRLLSTLVKRSDVQVILGVLPQELVWMEHEDQNFVQFFERIHLKQQTAKEYMKILKLAAVSFQQGRPIETSEETLQTILSYAERFPSLGRLPRAAISVLDESMGRASRLKRKALGVADVLAVLSDKTGVPLQQLEQNDLELVQKLEGELNQRIINQKPAVATIAGVLRRARLGLRNPARPLGSFLLLGPSGVGKTETAKLVAQLVFGRKENFTRFDMSEFGQEHGWQRLVGAPPGYVGYEAGGELTNAVKAEPYSLILLDEIEKAHPKVFDMFLQVIDDGRLTSGQGETIDFKQSIVMATSNLGVSEILEASKQGADIHGREFREEVLIPLLVKRFRLEFLNRFDAILVFNPLRLLEISKLEIKKIEDRLQSHRIAFRIDPATLSQVIAGMVDPRFGARPVKRFVEEVCETLMTRHLLQNKQKTA